MPVMKKITVLVIASLYTFIAYSQNKFTAVIKDAKTNKALVGATALLQGASIGSSSDTNGLVTLTKIPDGKQVIQFRYVGYETQLDTLDFPLTQNQPMVILLLAEG